jgi:outer membrane immunogenic protein
MKRVILGAAAAAAVTITPALAADIPARPAVPKAPVTAAPISSWSGCYLGAGGGYGMWNQGSAWTTDPTFGPVTVLSPTINSSGRGWFGTVGGGCDYQIGDRWLIGALADYDFSDLKGDFLNTNEGKFGREKLRSSWAVGGRIGWLATLAILTYVNGGYTQARFSSVDVFFATDPVIPTGTQLAATTYSGWFLGGGTEVMLSPGWFMRSEYRYARYDNEFIPFMDTATGARTGRGMDSDKAVQTIRTELVWKFNGSRLPSNAATSAHAADIPVKAPRPAPVTNWSGCYVDAGGGYGMWSAEATRQRDPGFGVVGILSATVASGGGHGWFGSVGGGCDFQVGDRWLIGAFADYDFSDLKGHFADPVSGEFGPEKLRSAWAVGGRIGWLVTPAILAYVSVGYTQARFDQVDIFFAFNPPVREPFYLPATTYSGWFLGGGTEFMLSPGWFVRNEYRYARYDNEFRPYLLTTTGASSALGVDSEKFVQTIRTELVWKWNWGGPVRAAY